MSGVGGRTTNGNIHSTVRKQLFVVEVKPTDDCANVESSMDQVELVVGPRDLGS
jgi:hypothetical protein